MALVAVTVAVVATAGGTSSAGVISPEGGASRDFSIARTTALSWDHRFTPLPASARAKRTAAPARASRSLPRAPLAPRDIAKVLLAKRGWSGQFSCLDSLWRKESNWKVNADNPTSSAYGIPQALPGAKMSSAGSDWRTNPATQIRWGIGYIAARYGSPCAAWHHSQAYNYY